VEFGYRCKRELIQQSEARELAAKHGIHLEGLGGTNQGIIGALAAVGLVSTGNDGRIVHVGTWPWPDDMKGGIVDAEAIYARGVNEIRVEATGAVLRTGKIAIEKNLRPNLRENGKMILFVEALAEGPARWRALKPT
jgi:hypothetical protein